MIKKLSNLLAVVAVVVCVALLSGNTISAQETDVLEKDGATISEIYVLVKDAHDNIIVPGAKKWYKEAKKSQFALFGKFCHDVVVEYHDTHIVARCEEIDKDLNKYNDETLKPFVEKAKKDEADYQKDIKPFVKESKVASEEFYEKNIETPLSEGLEETKEFYEREIVPINKDMEKWYYNTAVPKIVDSTIEVAQSAKDLHNNVVVPAVTDAYQKVKGWFVK